MESQEAAKIVQAPGYPSLGFHRVCRPTEHTDMSWVHTSEARLNPDADSQRQGWDHCRALQG